MHLNFKHYLTQFHPKHNNGANDYKLFNDKADDLNPERPAMTAWHVTSWAAGDRQLIARSTASRTCSSAASTSPSIHSSRRISRRATGQDAGNS